MCLTSYTHGKLPTYTIHSKICISPDLYHFTFIMLRLLQTQAVVFVPICNNFLILCLFFLLLDVSDIWVKETSLNPDEECTKKLPASSG